MKLIFLVSSVSFEKVSLRIPLLFLFDTYTPFPFVHILLFAHRGIAPLGGKVFDSKIQDWMIDRLPLSHSHLDDPPDECDYCAEIHSRIDTTLFYPVQVLLR